MESDDWSCDEQIHCDYPVEFHSQRDGGQYIRRSCEYDASLECREKPGSVAH
jgi:hypothetical protein